MASLPYPRTHRAFCWYILPRNTLSCCKISHRFHRFHRFLGCFQGVHLSQVHQQSKKCTNREGVPSARLVQLRQLHPLGVLPQNSRNTQNLLLRYSPTDFTDLHRNFCWDNFPQNSQNPQNLLLRYSPTEFTEPTEPSAEKNSRRFHRFTQILLVRRFCVFCEICGRITQAVSV